MLQETQNIFFFNNNLGTKINYITFLNCHNYFDSKYFSNFAKWYNFIACTYILSY